MLSLFSPLQSYVPSRSRSLQQPRTESLANRLHFRATFLVLMASSLLVTCLEWVGNGSLITCIIEGNVDTWVIPKNVLNTFCFIMTTFTLPKHHNSEVGETAVQPGVGPFNPLEDETSHKAYYQWVPFVLFLQACLFYTPHLVHKAVEGGKLQAIMMGLHQLVLDKKSRREKQRILAKYIADSRHTHNAWAIKMFLADVLNLVNVVAQMYFVDAFLGQEFSSYGLEVLRFLDADPEDRADPMALVFPRVTKCTFRKYGPSGSLQTHDALCVLPINIINEKIYIFLWFWLILVLLVTIASLFYHLFFLMAPALPKTLIRAKAMDQKDLRLDELEKELELGDWRLLHMLAQNMEPLVLAEFLNELGRVMDGDIGNNGKNGKSKRKVRPGSESGTMRSGMHKASVKSLLSE